MSSRINRLLTLAVASVALMGACMSPDTGGSSGGVATESLPSAAPKNPTFLADRARWFDSLKEAAKNPDAALTDLATTVRLTANQRNVRKLQSVIDTLTNTSLAANLRAHVAAINGRRYPGEYDRYFSESKAMASAASDLFTGIRQAIEAGNHEATI